MKTCNGRLLEIIQAQFKVNDLVGIHTDIVCNSSQESSIILLLNVEPILLFWNRLNAFAHKLIDNCGGYDRLQMSFFVEFELCV